MEGAPGECTDDSVVSSQFAPKHVSGLIRYAIHDATITVATNQSTTQPSTPGERTNELLKLAAKTTPSPIPGRLTARPTSSATPKWHCIESGLIALAAG